MKVIITGGEGFIGKALAVALLMRGIDVVSIDRLNGIEAGEYFTSSDLSGIDGVYHLAAQTSVFNGNKTDIIQDNINTFKIVCDACARHSIKLVYASSSTAADGNTTSLYGISKRFDEEYARCYHPRASGIRFHNVYGHSPRYGTLLWHLLNDKRVKLYNGGRNIRHFTYIDDIVEGLIFAFNSDIPLMNACNPQSTSTLQLATLVKRYNGVEIETVEESRDFDRKEQSVDNSVYTIPLQYTSIEDGIRRIFEHMKPWMKADRPNLE